MAKYRKIDAMIWNDEKFRTLSHEDKAEIIRMIVFDEDTEFDIYKGPSFRVNDPTVDHVVPVSRGGTASMENLVVACRSCNSRKGDKI
jgi:5-methylcytosine-specific restriction endonuclease McrA